MEAQTWMLVMSHADGTTTNVELSTQPSISITDTTINITSPVASMIWEAKEIIRLTYQNTDTGIRSSQERIEVFLSDKLLVFPNVGDANDIRVYKTNGTQVDATFIPYREGIAMVLSSIHSGIYMIKTKERTFKYAKP